MGEGASNRAPVTDLGVTDLAGDMREQGDMLVQDGADLEVAMPGQGADGHRVPVGPDI